MRRYQLTADPRQLPKLSLRTEGVTGPFVGEQLHNIAPGATVPVIYQAAGGATLTPFRWGMVYNRRQARSIRAATLFNEAARHLRQPCLFPATGFYEWEFGLDGQPYLFQLREGAGMFLIAGVWQLWQSPHGPVRTAAAVTTRPNEMLAQLTDRMPVILDAAGALAWLDRPEFDHCAAVHRGRLEAIPISPLINDPENNAPRFIQRVPGRRRGKPLW